MNAESRSVQAVSSIRMRRERGGGGGGDERFGRGGVSVRVREGGNCGEKETTMLTTPPRKKIQNRNFKQWRKRRKERNKGQKRKAKVLMTSSSPSLLPPFPFPCLLAAFSPIPPPLLFYKPKDRPHPFPPFWRNGPEPICFEYDRGLYVTCGAREITYGAPREIPVTIKRLGKSSNKDMKFARYLKKGSGMNIVSNKDMK